MRIKECRKNADMTQQQLADSMGVVRSSVTNWELEVSLPGPRQLPLLAQVLGVTIDELFEPIEGAS
ncbi:MAG: helix-turn-helix transcriptional regulator [Candidatus Enterenecus sp.]